MTVHTAQFFFDSLGTRLEHTIRKQVPVEGGYTLRVFPCNEPDHTVKCIATMQLCVSNPSRSMLPITAWMLRESSWRRSRWSSRGSATVTCGPLLVSLPSRRWLDPKSHGGQAVLMGSQKMLPRTAVFLTPLRALRTSGISSAVWGTTPFLLRTCCIDLASQLQRPGNRCSDRSTRCRQMPH